jgi:isopentenyl diphosphate isomerase/L-lactate dehydrogenase-like FMN-dependent dehydrogenase
VAVEAPGPAADLADLRTLAMFETRAQATLPPDVWAFAYGGSSSEATLERNRRALQHLAIEQRVLMNVHVVDITATFLGMTLPSPIIVAPMGGMYRFHPQGDVEIARGATRAGGMSVVSGVAGWPLEEIGAAVSGPLMFQLYWLGDRDWVAEKLQHVVAGGFKAFCLTVDTAAYSRRDRDIMLRTPGQRRGGPVPAPELRDTQSPLTWADVDWVRRQIPLPFGLKGILTAADARLAVQHGVDFVWVSNHGGRQLDDGRATIDALSEIVDAVQGRVPIIVDSGFRRGTDAIKALALGATLVAYGRTPLWGLACGGADGVQAVLGLLNEELTIGMKLAGRTVSSQLPRDVIRRVDASGFAPPPPTTDGNRQTDFMAQMSPRQQEVVRAVTENPDLSEVEKMWGITEALFGTEVHKGVGG